MNKKKFWVVLTFVTIFAISYPAVLIAAEHGGKEHGGKEHGGMQIEGSHVEGSHGVEAGYAHATAEIRATQEESPISGQAMFTETENGLKIEVEIAGAPPGKHGFHIHEKGDCSDAGNAAGGHFNPEGAPHGDVLKEGVEKVHPGDLGNIEVGSDGKGALEKVIPGLTLKKGKYGVAGRALILHEKEDNFGQPTGNAGGRIACAVITEP